MLAIRICQFDGWKEENERVCSIKPVIQCWAFAMEDHVCAGKHGGREGILFRLQNASIFVGLFIPTR